MCGKIIRPNFYVQWHITDRCSQRCKYCYLFQSENYHLQKFQDANIAILSQIVEDVFKTAETLKANPIFVLTGGDPILYPSLWELLQKINDCAVKFKAVTAIDILGNPSHIDYPTALKMKKHGIRKYQLSLDGLRGKHDYLRKEGSYNETFRAAKTLKRAGISTSCMFTLSKFNAPDLLGVMHKVAEKEFDAFAFARFCRPDNWTAEEYRQQMFTPMEYKALLATVDEAHRELAKKHPKIRFVLKDHLWELFFYEKYSDEQQKELGQIRKNKIVVGGCGLGIASVSILSDGVVYACRRFPSPIGKVPYQSLLDIFINSNELNKLRDLRRYTKCRKCPLLYVCRGCGAVAYGFLGSFFASDPQCWRDS